MLGQSGGDLEVWDGLGESAGGERLRSQHLTTHRVILVVFLSTTDWGLDHSWATRMTNAFSESFAQTTRCLGFHFGLFWLRAQRGHNAWAIASTPRVSLHMADRDPIFFGQTVSGWREVKDLHETLFLDDFSGLFL